MTPYVMFGLLVAGALVLAWLRRTPWLEQCPKCGTRVEPYDEDDDVDPDWRRFINCPKCHNLVDLGAPR